MSSIDEIKAKIDIVRYIERYVPLKKAGQYHKACCPFHSESTPSFMVSESRQTWRCYGACNEGGDIFDFVQKLEGLTFQEALEKLAAETGVQLKKPDPAKPDHSHIHAMLKEASDAYARMLARVPQVREYLAERGLREETIAAWGIGYAPPKWDGMLKHLTALGYSQQNVITAGLARESNGKVYDYFRDRIMFPLLDARGRHIGFAGRAFAAQEPKYLNSPQTPVFTKGDTLYAYHLARRHDEIVIVEGYMDVIQAHQAGFTNVVAQMGTAFTEHQVKLLESKRVIIALDGDEAGQRAINSGLEDMVKTGLDIRIATLPEGDDPDDVIRASPDRWRSTIEAAVPIAKYIIQQAIASLSPQASIIEREKTATKLLPTLLRVESDIYRMDNIQELALAFGLPEQELLNRAMLWKNNQQPPAGRPDAPQETAFIPLEAQLLQTWIRDDSAYYQVRRIFLELDLEKFGPLDFTGAYRHIAEVFEQAVANYRMEIRDHLKAHLDPDMYPLLRAEPLSVRIAVQVALRIRVQRLEEAISAQVALSNYERAGHLSREKARIMLSSHF
ncbi:MAG: hypothetical protein OHK0046_47580 [Anaerolineae bacterium]